MKIQTRLWLGSGGSDIWLHEWCLRARDFASVSTRTEPLRLQVRLLLESLVDPNIPLPRQRSRRRDVRLRWALPLTNWFNLYTAA